MRKGWEMKKLGDVCEIINGKNQNAVLSVDGKYPIYGSAGNNMGYANDFICEKGTTIIGRKGNISNPLFINERFWNVDTAFGIYPKNNFVPKFIYFLCLTIDFKSRNRGTTIPSLVKSDLLNIEIPFTQSLSEQQRIVAIIDKCFTAIDQAKSIAEQNLKNAKELFESYLNGVFENKGDDWEEKKLGEIIKYDKNQSLHKGLPYVGLEHIESNSGRFLGSLEPQEVKSSTFSFNSQHILYGRLRPYLNKVLLPDFEGHCSTEIFPIKVNEKIDREFLFFWLIASSTVKKIDATWTGARMPRANMNQVLEFYFSFPSLKVQHNIIRKLNSLRTETQELQKHYQNKINNFEELKKSILQKAFRGEL